jgi:hypothetical protein
MLDARVNPVSATVRAFSAELLHFLPEQDANLDAVPVVL